VETWHPGEGGHHQTATVSVAFWARPPRSHAAHSGAARSRNSSACSTGTPLEARDEVRARPSARSSHILRTCADRT